MYNIEILITDTTYRRGSGFFQRGAWQNAENQGHSSIELEMHKQYIAELPNILKLGM